MIWSYLLKSSRNSTGILLKYHFLKVVLKLVRSWLFFFFYCHVLYDSSSIIIKELFFCYYYYKKSFFAGLVCKACSYEALSNNHEWKRRSSTDALNNNLRPKSEFSDGSTASLNKNRKVPVTDICLNDPFEVGDGKLHFLFSLFQPTVQFNNLMQNNILYAE